MKDRAEIHNLCKKYGDRLELFSGIRDISAITVAIIDIHDEMAHLTEEFLPQMRDKYDDKEEFLAETVATLLVSFMHIRDHAVGALECIDKLIDAAREK